MILTRQKYNARPGKIFVKKPCLNILLLCFLTLEVVVPKLGKFCLTGWFFFTGSALKVLNVGDGKIPTKRVKVRVSHRENMKS